MWCRGRRFECCSCPKRLMACPRSILSSGALLSKRKLLPWWAWGSQGQPPASLASAGEGNFIHTASEHGQGKRKYQEGQPGQDLGFWQERLADQLLPLWRLMNEEQLKVKFEVTKKTLEQLQHRLHKLGTVVAEAERPSGLLQPFIPSPVIEGYRNKSVFSVNRGPDGHQRTVGCFLRSPGGKKMFCVPADHLKTVPARHLQVAQCYEAFLKQTPLDPRLDIHQLGPWRRLRVRTSSQGHTMAIITFHAQGLSQEAICAQKERAKEFFTSGPGAVCDLTSLYLKERVTSSPKQSCFHHYQLLSGEPYLFEDILGLKLRISPGAFFPPNTSTTEALFQVPRASHWLSGQPRSSACDWLGRLWRMPGGVWPSMRSPTGSASGGKSTRPWPGSGSFKGTVRRWWHWWTQRAPDCLTGSLVPSGAAQPSRS
ncbi:tRNA (uracil-5-)-methyltransferase homolog B-like isoform X5 [Petaurus breviceps papuanus]|uniref:tRNA (uracil-5-)-methyltransferase homolog B-like isoform X5 n=1 Tax=Petaurus breviceps papuanus TaxID=3040969 RepID=UPI0036D76E86